MWIKRDISTSISENSDVIQILTGPRQCGKTSLALKLGSDFIEVSFDDFSQRELAQADPALFLSRYSGQKVFLDEAQLAPHIFSELKRKADLFKRSQKKHETLYRLTGSNQILIDKNVKESLAGRASFFELNTLSVAEIRQWQKIPIAEILYKGGWPELYLHSEKKVNEYLDNYLNTYIEKDIVLSAGIQKSVEFLRFCRLLAGRTGQILVYGELAKEVGVEGSTIKDWISVLTKMKLISLVEPYYSNISKRLIKSPKVYFLDSGLACRLQGWTQQEPILVSPHAGALFETLVFAEIHKTMKNFRKSWQIYHWRSRDGEEIDFMIEMENQKKLFIEAKKTIQPLKTISAFPELKKIFKEKAPPRIMVYMEGDIENDTYIPICKLRDFLLRF